MILDTCFCVDIMREVHQNVPRLATKKLEELGDVSLFIPLFVICELQAGANLAQNPKREMRKIEFLKEYVEVIYPDSSFSGIYGRLEAVLRKAGTPVPTMDLLIATTAIMKSMPLITNNVKDFEPIPGLVIETY